MQYFNRLTGLSLFVCLCVGCSSEKKHTSETTQPKNVIVLIGDGMGLSQVSTAFYYQDKTPNFEKFKTIGLIKTSSSSDLITDSAAGATAFSTGKKTYNSAIGMRADSTYQENIVEILSKKDLKSGIISTSSITHATPASFYAHVKTRKQEEDIAAWMPGSDIDYFAGGGLQFFTNRKDSVDYLLKLKDSGFVVNTEKISLDQTLSKDQKYGFLLADKGMPKMSQGRGQFLETATKQAIDYLSGSNAGFFLMVEGSQIDWGGHDNDADYIISEVQDFDNAIGVALDFAKKDGNTIVVVTADHETGGFTLASTPKTGSDGNSYNDYNSISPSFSTSGHSATLIPVFAYGPGSREFSGIYENTEIFDKLIVLLDE